MTPKGWFRVLVGELLESVSAGVSVNSQGRPRLAGELGVLKTSAVTYGRFQASENKAVVDCDLHRARLNPRRGCVLMSRMNTVALVGAAAYVDRDWPDLVLPDRIWQLKFHSTRADGRWFHQLISSPTMRGRLSELATGTSGSMKNLGQDKLLNLEIAVPPLPEQKKIAAILSSVDDAIESTRSVIEQLGAVKQAMMAELLTRGLPGRHTRFKQTEIGELPEAWSVGTLAQLIESCDYGLSKALSGFPVGPAVLRMGNLSDGLVVLDDLKYIDADAVPASLFLRRGDVLFNRTNSKDLVGKVGVFLGSPHPVSFASYLLRLRPLQDTTSGEWLGAVMNLGVNQARLREMATPGISQVNINRGIMLSMKVAIPPLAEQVELMNVLSSASERVHSETVATEQLRNLKSALMSVLLTGELRVHPDEDAA